MKQLMGARFKTLCVLLDMKSFHVIADICLISIWRSQSVFPMGQNGWGSVSFHPVSTCGRHKGTRRLFR